MRAFKISYRTDVDIEIQFFLIEKVTGLGMKFDFHFILHLISNKKIQRFTLILGDFRRFLMKYDEIR